jgi:uncharacterized membrane protein (UPF0127 family)
MKRLYLLAILLLVLPACSSKTADGRVTAPRFDRGTAIIESGGRTLRLPVQIADTDRSRVRGLMGRARLDANAGMAFLFDEPEVAGFWMKDTLIPLSIAFWDARGRIVAIFEMAPCGEGPCPLTRSPSPVVGALETNAGYFDRHRVRPGDRIRVVYT